MQPFLTKIIACTFRIRVTDEYKIGDELAWQQKF